MLDGALSGEVPRTGAGGTEPRKDETGDAEEERRDPVLDVVVVRPRFVSGDPGRQRLGRLDPVDDREDDQRDADDDGKPDENAPPIHGRLA